MCVQIAESLVQQRRTQRGETCACAFVLSRVRLFVTPWLVACPAPLSMEFSRQEHWSQLPFPPPGDLLNPGIELISPESPALAGRFFTTKPSGKPPKQLYPIKKRKRKTQLQGDL